MYYHGKGRNSAPGNIKRSDKRFNAAAREVRRCASTI
jgi:hypothetical protein